MDDPVMALLQAAEEGSHDEADSLAEQVLRMDLSDRRALDGAIARLAPALGAARMERAGIVALVIGALVENGGEALPALDPLIRRSTEAFLKAMSFLEACLRCSPEEEPSLEALSHVSVTMPEEARCWKALEYLYKPLVSILSRCPRSRARARDHRPFLNAVGALAPHHGGADFLCRLLHVLDGEEVLVLHPRTHQGYRVRIGGISDNFQLHLLLCDALSGDPSQGWLAGEKPDPKVVAVAKGEGPQHIDALVVGRWNMYQWTALLPDQSLPGGLNDHNQWIWGEGMPADIAFFEGTRALLLDRPNYLRTWNADRIFDGLKATLEVVAILGNQEVGDILRRMASHQAR